MRRGSLFSLAVCVVSVAAIAGSLPAVSSPAPALASAVVSQPLPPGKISNGPLRVPVSHPTQSAPAPGSPAAIAIARFKAKFAASLAAPHRAPGAPQPAPIQAAAAQIAALRAHHLLTSSPVLSGKPVKDVRTGPMPPVTTVSGPSLPLPANGPVLPARAPTSVTSRDPLPSLTSVVYGATYSIAAVSPIPTYATPGAVQVTVVNTSNFSWGSNIELGYHLWNAATGTWYNLEGEFTALGATVPSGWELTVNLAIEELPAGSFQVYPDLFDETDFNNGGPGWFSRQSPPVPVKASSTFTVPHLAPTASPGRHHPGLRRQRRHRTAIPHQQRRCLRRTPKSKHPRRRGMG